MELIESKKQVPRRAVKATSTDTLEIPSIIAIGTELNKLNNMFAAASFILAAHEMHAELKMRVIRHLYQLDSSSMGIRRLARGRQIDIGIMLEAEISSLRIRLEKFKSKLFKKPHGSRHLL
jgi:hypothetical protein